MILDKEEFQSGTKTIRCAVGHGRVSRWSIIVVDTPGWSLFGLANPEQVRLEIGRSTSLCPTRSKVKFLLAIPMDSFKEKNRRATEKYLSILGDEVWRRSVVLFTFGHELRGKTIEKHVEEKGGPLQWVLKRCANHYHVFDINTTNQTQICQLLEMMEQL
ncbi:hypothetical protein LDENG_00218120 [Lucifuga dentata]|nr:hypothetical protein LDENG_00218120 [Lucifuga dentata]